MSVIEIEAPRVAPQSPVTDEVRDVLRKAKGLISAGWCQRVRFDPRGAGSFCILGALSMAAYGDADASVPDMWDYLAPFDAHLPRVLHGDLVSFNDAMFTTQAEVVDLFDRALGA